MIGTALSTSLDGFIAAAGDTEELHPAHPLTRHGHGGDTLFCWLTAGGTPSKINPAFTMFAPSAAFFDAGVAATGAVVAGRRNYNVSGAWAGRGPMPGIPLFVLTHSVPDEVPAGDPPYMFVTDGIETAIERARTAAQGKNVQLIVPASSSRRSCP